jgi:hypothetical protein
VPKNMLEHMPEHHALADCSSNASCARRTHARTDVRTTHLGNKSNVSIARRGAERFHPAEVESAYASRGLGVPHA